MSLNDMNGSSVDKSTLCRYQVCFTTTIPDARKVCFKQPQYKYDSTNTKGTAPTNAYLLHTATVSPRSSLLTSVLGTGYFQGMPAKMPLSTALSSNRVYAGEGLQLQSPLLS
jgi:hypothetical protein